MRRCFIFVLSVFLNAPPAVAGDGSVDIAAIEGTYREQLALYDSSGASYSAENLLEIVQCGKDRAFIYTELNFVNYHECSLAGFVESEKGVLVYKPDADEGSPCALRIVPGAGRIVFEDPDEQCSIYCGARGHFDAGNFSIGVRRKVTDAEKERIDKEIYEGINEECGGRTNR